MPLSSGDKLGHYEVLSLLGQGGTGEVYRARDTKLKREVAIKVLPEAFARDPERMARFQREAEVLASLNHSNIAAIYGVEERALVMELVEGESPKGPLSFDEAWKIASQMCAALEYAHEKGIVHRDLKPANIKITPEGVVKLLDFGLAKAFTNPGEARTSSADGPENSPTLTIGATAVGVILGTAAYMPPEQAKGKMGDKRADIWAFGVVLYELLTGERLFRGEDVSDTLAQVLTKEPDVGKVPVKVRRLLRRCLDKDPKKRLRDLGEAPYLIDEVTLAPETSSAAPSKAGVNWLWPALAGVLLLLAGAAGYGWWIATRPVARPLVQLSADLGSQIPAEQSTGPRIAISPDGARIAFISPDAKGASRLLVRLLESANVTELAAGEARAHHSSPRTANGSRFSPEESSRRFPCREARP